MSFFDTPNLDTYIVLGIIVVFALIEGLDGLYTDSKRSKDDWFVEILGFTSLNLLKPLVFLIGIFGMNLLFPGAVDRFSGWELLGGVVFYLLIDDILQYWYHRAAHEYQWLWKLHRPHHAAREMGVMTAYRNAALYYFLLPNLWWAGICTYLGLASAVAIGLVLKQIIIISSHSAWNWDKKLYKIPFLSPILSVVERIIVTPAFHFSHHGRTMQDGISDPNGNFGNAFSIWDQLFGTAKFTRQFPEEYGLQTDPGDKWSSHLLYPLITSDKPGSEISADYQRVQHKGTEPLNTKLTAGHYLYCQCGYSSDQPFCNGSHQGSKVKPLRFEVKSERKVSLCTCKLTKTPPYCDNSHLTL